MEGDVSVAQGQDGALAAARADELRREIEEHNYRY